MEIYSSLNKLDRNEVSYNSIKKSLFLYYDELEISLIANCFIK